MLRLTLPAPAKINLCLRVTGRQTDGYHAIDSIIVPLELADAVEIQLELCSSRAAPTISCRCLGAPALDGPQNLAARAAAAFLQRCERCARVSLTLHKQIWVAAGLGGGSSDAAAVLLGLQRLLGGLTDAELHALACELGADVPFFLLGTTARARGRGELLEPLSPPPPLELVLLNPGAPLNTAEVYRELRLSLGQALSPGLELRGWPPPRAAALAALLQNDLQPVARRLQPLIDTMGQALEQAGALGTALTGSGPTVFGLFATEAAARAAAEQLSSMTDFFVQRSRPRGAGAPAASA